MRRRICGKNLFFWSYHIEQIEAFTIDFNEAISKTQQIFSILQKYKLSRFTFSQFNTFKIVLVKILILKTIYLMQRCHSQGSCIKTYSYILPSANTLRIINKFLHHIIIGNKVRPGQNLPQAQLRLVMGEVKNRTLPVADMENIRMMVFFQN